MHSRRLEHAGARPRIWTDVPIGRPASALHKRPALTGAERQRLRRRRERRGEKVLRIVITDYHALVGLLLDLGRLTEAEAQDPDLVAAAVSAAIDDLVDQA